MTAQPIFQLVLILATFLCSLVAGFLFAFAIVVMPGIRRLSDRAFIRSFQAMDGIIQNNQPFFVLVWAGSALALLVAVVLGWGQLTGVGRLLIIVATLAYFLGVQLPTLTINVPLNNSLQAHDVDTMTEAAQKSARAEFEPRWNRWNGIRTMIAALVSLLLMALLIIL